MSMPTRRLFNASFQMRVLLSATLLLSTACCFFEAPPETTEEQCVHNLREMYKWLVLCCVREGALPKKDGVQFFAYPYAKGIVSPSKMNARTLTCPAVDLSELAIGAEPWSRWWDDFDSIDGTFSSYAGRSMSRSPIHDFPGDGAAILIADDNDAHANHFDVTHALLADGTIKAYSLRDLKSQGLIPVNVESLLVGPESPLPELRCLSKD